VVGGLRPHTKGGWMREDKWHIITKLNGKLVDGAFTQTQHDALNIAHSILGEALDRGFAVYDIITPEQVSFSIERIKRKKTKKRKNKKRK